MNTVQSKHDDENKLISSDTKSFWYEKNIYEKYYSSRMYSAQQSRFTTQVPTGMADSPNIYAYVGNNPVNKRDPTGLTVEPTMIDGAPTPPSGFTECPDGHWEYYEFCVDYYDDSIGERSAQESCAEICFGDDGGGLPSFTIDEEEYEQCLQDEIVDISSSEAACMVGSTGGAAVATVAIALAGTGAPEPLISKATAGAASAAAITYFALGVVGGCIGGSLVSNYDDAINVLFCSVNSLTWE